MLLYPLFPFSGDACRRTPRTPWPSSEYHILPDSCQPSTDGWTAKKGEISLWKEHQPWFPVKLELRETVKNVYLFMDLYTFVFVCGKVGGYFILRIIFEPQILSVLAHAFDLLGWLWWEFRLATLGDILCTVYSVLCLSMCVISGPSWYPRIAGFPRSPRRYWWKGE